MGFFDDLENEVKKKEFLLWESMKSNPRVFWNKQELALLKQTDPEMVEETKIRQKMYENEIKDLTKETKEITDMKVKARYKDAADPKSDFSRRIDAAIERYGLEDNPKGRLIAAKIVQAEH